MNTQAIETAQRQSSTGNNLSEQDFLNIVKEYTASLSLKGQHDSLQFLICPVGMIGSGKTTTLKKINETIPFVCIRTDDMRALLKKHGYNFLKTKELALEVAIQILEKGYSIALDSDCAGDKVREKIDSIAKTFPKLEIIWIHIIASDNVIKKRLSPDNEKRVYKGPEAIERYEIRKVLHENLPMQFDATIDTGSDHTKTDFENVIKIITERI
ncbi:MAG: hypothetical protein AUJ37_04750 [Candidatus Magasanikbacteria bacterium CG1_02_41_34]|nr:MAG: hypothetical protein AUJ37_04750 [Candidatus Magasanikbacteria bacterium CG1_02_41_34]